MATRPKPQLLDATSTNRLQVCKAATGGGKKIWIDLENSPHVPFFKPIVEELEHRGHSVIITARDCFQVCELAHIFRLRYRKVGHHFGKHTVAKLSGLAIRALQMSSYVLREKPDLAVSHGSRSQLLLSKALGIPTVLIFDYEYAKWVSFLRPSWVMSPDVIPDDAAIAALNVTKDRILKYPGIKEDVYASTFLPNPAIRQQLCIGDEDLVVVIRPPATEAHYHNPESEKLLDAVFEQVAHQSAIKVILLPRTTRQENELRNRWASLFQSGTVLVPKKAADGLELIWISDLVISGGGTMNREAAALGVPVYSIFRGKIGAVDRYLSDVGRLTLLASIEDVYQKIRFIHRRASRISHAGDAASLHAVVSHIEMVLNAGQA